MRATDDALCKIRADIVEAMLHTKRTSVPSQRQQAPAHLRAVPLSHPATLGRQYASGASLLAPVPATSARPVAFTSKRHARRSVSVVASATAAHSGTQLTQRLHTLCSPDPHPSFSAAHTRQCLSSAVVHAVEQLTLQPIKTISGTVKLPGSKSLSNRILLLAALAEGTTVVKNLLVSAAHTQAAWRQRPALNPDLAGSHASQLFVCPIA